MFRLIQPPSGQIQNIVLVQWVTAHIMGYHRVSTHWMYQYYVLYLAWWWLNEPKHVAEFLIWIPNISCVYWLIKLLYYCKTQRNDSFKRLNKPRNINNLIRPAIWITQSLYLGFQFFTLYKRQPPALSAVVLQIRVRKVPFQTSGTMKNSLSLFRHCQKTAKGDY
jgi:hypothetical protein